MQVDKSAKHKSILTSIYGIGMLLSIAGLIIFFLLPTLTSDKKFWVIGTMSSSHKFIEGDCQSCHSTPFTPINDQNCLNCHNVTTHPNTNYSLHLADNHNNEAREYSKLQPSCVDCHIEHSEDKGLVISDPRTCNSCHKNLKSHYEKTKLRDVIDFASHPEFLLPKMDSAKIKLNHEVHLKKDLRSEEGYKTLICGDCHEISDTQKLMKPVYYEDHCSSCHKLELDGELESKKIPHAAPNIVFDFIFKEYLARYYLEHNKNKKNESDAIRIRPGVETVNSVVTAEVLRFARELESELFMDRGCALCHFVKKKADSLKLSETESQYEIDKTKISKKWFPNVDFKHLSHEILKCESCHEGVNKSSKTEDISLPKIKDCNSCHSKEGGASEDCITCHSYHQSLGLSEEKKRKNF